MSALRRLKLRGHFPRLDTKKLSTILSQLNVFSKTICHHWEAANVAKRIGANCSNFELHSHCSTVISAYELDQLIMANPNLPAIHLTSLSLFAVEGIGLLHVICTHLPRLRFLHIQFSKDNSSVTLTNRTVVHLAKLSQLEQLHLSYVTFQLKPIVTSTERLSSLKQLTLLHIQQRFSFARFCRAFGRVCPNLEDLELGLFEDHQLMDINKEHLKQFGMLKGNRIH